MLRYEAKTSHLGSNSWKNNILTRVTFAARSFVYSRWLNRSIGRPSHFKQNGFSALSTSLDLETPSGLDCHFVDAINQAQLRDDPSTPDLDAWQPTSAKNFLHRGFRTIEKLRHIVDIKEFTEVLENRPLAQRRRLRNVKCCLVHAERIAERKSFAGSNVKVHRACFKKDARVNSVELCGNFVINSRSTIFNLQIQISCLTTKPFWRRNAS